MVILGIETSCDETSAALVDGSGRVLSNVVSSSANLFSELGGVVPEMASRAQLEYVGPVITKALEVLKEKTFEEKPAKIDAIAVTRGPGLLGSLLVGINYAKTISYSSAVPLIGVNHLIAHLYANWLGKKHPQFPCLHLLVSGGHTMLILQKSHADFEILGETLDDAAGESFDKVGKLLGLEYPAGPGLSKLALEGDKEAFTFPRAILNEPNLDFSFSGLKTAVRIALEKSDNSDQTKKNIAASFEEAVIDVLVQKSLKAVKMFKPKSFALSGGVSANSRLRERITKLIGLILGQKNIYIPKLEYTGDNAAMVAMAAFWHKKLSGPLILDAEPSLYL